MKPWEVSRLETAELDAMLVEARALRDARTARREGGPAGIAAFGGGTE